MPTFTIVDKDKDPLGPNEIKAGGTINVQDGDVYIFDSTANKHTTFKSADGFVKSFSVQFNESNPNKFDVKFSDVPTANLNPSISIADDVDLSDVKIDAGKAASAQLTAGDNVTLAEYNGSAVGADTIDIGDHFTTTSEIKSGGGDDVITIGDNFTGKKINSGDGDDTIRIGANADLDDIDSGKGDDSITIGDNFTGKKIDSGDGDDTIRIGANADLEKIDGGKGNDVLYTQTDPGDIKKIDKIHQDDIHVVCFARGTMIKTWVGERAVEDLATGDLVLTMDNGFRPISWISQRSLSEMDLRRKTKLRPVRIQKGALGNGLPCADLVVSPQHRVLFRSPIAERMFGNREVLVAARQMLGMPGVDIAETTDGVTYFHFMFDAHEVVFSNGAPTESMFAGPQAVLALDAEARDEIVALFPELLQPDANPVPARPFPDTGRRARRLVERHVITSRPIAAQL